MYKRQTTTAAAAGVVSKAAGGWSRQGGGAYRKRRRGRFGVGAASTEGSPGTAGVTARCRRSNHGSNGTGERGRFCSDDAVTSFGGDGGVSGSGVFGGDGGGGGGSNAAACGRRVDGYARCCTGPGRIVAVATASRAFGS